MKDRPQRSKRPPWLNRCHHTTMTEEEWLKCIDPQPMLEFLRGRASGRKPRVSERKIRLFAVACSRRIWDRIDALGRRAVDVAEMFADGLAGPDEMRAARLACQGAGGQAAWYAAATNSTIAARNAALSAQAGAAMLGTEADEIRAQAKLLREIVGDPFRPLSVDPAWLTPGVVNLAQATYDERAFDRMPELAGELEKAGCDNDNILAHCRAPGLHVRGCWVIDLLLGKS